MTRAAGTRTAMRPRWASCPCCPRSRRPTRRHGSSQVGAVQRLGPECAWQGAHGPSTVIPKHVERVEPSAREELRLQSLLLLMHGIGGFSVCAGGTDRAVGTAPGSPEASPWHQGPSPTVSLPDLPFLGQAGAQGPLGSETPPDLQDKAARAPWHQPAPAADS